MALESRRCAIAPNVPLSPVVNLGSSSGRPVLGSIAYFSPPPAVLGVPISVSVTWLSGLIASVSLPSA
jgi:hypothetical protein